jgi:hypothetical protein
MFSGLRHRFTWGKSFLDQAANKTPKPALRKLFNFSGATLTFSAKYPENHHHEPHDHAEP